MNQSLVSFFHSKCVCLFLKSHRTLTRLHHTRCNISVLTLQLNSIQFSTTVLFCCVIASCFLSLFLLFTCLILNYFFPHCLDRDLSYPVLSFSILYCALAFAVGIGSLVFDVFINSKMYSELLYCFCFAVLISFTYLSYSVPTKLKTIFFDTTLLFSCFCLDHMTRICLVVIL